MALLKTRIPDDVIPVFMGITFTKLKLSPNIHLLNKYIKIRTMKKLFKNFEKESQLIIVSHINMSGNNLWKVFFDTKERIIKTLLWVNAGGTITVLAYNKNTYSASLYIFLFGLFCAFILVIYDYFFSKRYLENYSGDICKFYNNEISFDNIEHFARKKSKKNLLFNCCLWLSIVSSFLGTIIGITGYFKMHG